MINPIDMLSWWINHSAKWQAYISIHASGWMQKVLKGAPDWVKMTAVVGYGAVQPFLPAALVAGSRASIWHWVAVWRAIGWTVILALTNIDQNRDHLSKAVFLLQQSQHDRRV
jgi:hypothetical protein